MPNLVVSIEGANAAVSRRRRPVLVARKVFRKQVKSLKMKLEQLMRRDDKEDARGQQEGYSPYLYREARRSKIDNAMKVLIDRCSQVLADKA